MKILQPGADASVIPYMNNISELVHNFEFSIVS